MWPSVGSVKGFCWRTVVTLGLPARKYEVWTYPALICKILNTGAPYTCQAMVSSVGVCGLFFTLPCSIRPLTRRIFALAESVYCVHLRKRQQMIYATRYYLFMTLSKQVVWTSVKKPYAVVSIANMWISKNNDIKPEFKVKALFWRSNKIYIYAEGTPKEYHRRLGIQNRRKLENETWRTLLPNTVSESIRSILEQCANRIKWVSVLTSGNVLKESSICSIYVAASNSI